MSDAEPNDEDAPRWKSPLDAGVDWVTMSKEASAKAAEIERESKIRALVLLDAYAAGDLDAGIGGLRLEAADADAVFRAIAAYQTDLEIQATMPPPARRNVCGWCVLAFGDAHPSVLDFGADQAALTAHIHGCEWSPLVMRNRELEVLVRAIPQWMSHVCLVQSNRGIGNNCVADCLKCRAEEFLNRGR